MSTLDIPKKPAARRAWILYQLQLRGLSYAELARRLAVTAPAVRNATRNPYPRMERIIAEAIDLTPQQIWPERYDQKTGRPLSGRGERGIGRHPSRLKRNRPSNNNRQPASRNVNRTGAE